MSVFSALKTVNTQVILVWLISYKRNLDDLIFCRCQMLNSISCCFCSHYPWYEIFYSLLNLTAEILNRSDNNNVDLILEQIYNLEVPEEYGAPVEVITPNLKDVRIFDFTCFPTYFSLST